MGGAVRSPDYGNTRFEVHQFFFLKAVRSPRWQCKMSSRMYARRSIDDIDQGWRAGYFAYLPPILRVMRALTRFSGNSRMS